MTRNAQMMERIPKDRSERAKIPNSCSVSLENPKILEGCLKQDQVLSERILKGSLEGSKEGRKMLQGSLRIEMIVVYVSFEVILQ